MLDSTNHRGYQEDAAVVTLLKALGKQKDQLEGCRVHADILKWGSHTRNLFIGSSLVSMYAKQGSLAKAQQVFEELSSPTIVTWNTLMAGFAQHGHSGKAIRCFERCQADGIPPDGVTFLCMLKACGNIGAVAKGEEIHDRITKEGWLRDHSILGSALVDMYAKCGALEKAQEVFDELPARNVVSWTGLITGYAQHGHGQKALDCFARMQEGEGLSPNAVTFASILKACGDTGAAAQGCEIHYEIVRKGLLCKDMVLGTALVDMYAKCGSFAKAEQVFSDLNARDVASWNALISGYCQHGHGEEALERFEEMQHEGLSPDVVTFSCILKACCSIGAVEKGQDLHNDIARKGLLEKYNVLRLALIEMYAKCGALAKAQQTFDELPVRDVVAWNTLITGCCHLGHCEEALTCFDKMKQEGLSPDKVTFACILKACGSVGGAEKGEEVHAAIVREGMLEESVLGSALVDLYVKLGALPRAQEVFDRLPVQEVVAWTALIAGYCQHGHGEQALNCFDDMKHDGVVPDAVTFVCILKACGSIGAAEKGAEIHAEIAREGSLGQVTSIGNALVDMYAKCGALLKAQEVFDALAVQDLVSWTALIGGCCQHGLGEKALHCFELMTREGLSPDAVTFACILKACGSSMGAAEKGQMYYETMSESYGVIPTVEHHTCMVDLLGRAGHLHKAMVVIEKMPSAQHLPGWSALVSACRKQGNMMLGSWAFEYAV